MPPIDGHIIFLKTCIEQVFEKTQEKLLVAVLEYSRLSNPSKSLSHLTPRASALSTVGKYPTQLVQATEALRLVLAKGFKPADVGSPLPEIILTKFHAKSDAEQDKIGRYWRRLRRWKHVFESNFSDLASTPWCGDFDANTIPGWGASRIAVG